MNEKMNDKSALQSFGMILLAMGVVFVVLSAAGLMALFAHHMIHDPRATQWQWFLGGGTIAIIVGVCLRRMGGPRREKAE